VSQYPSRRSGQLGKPRPNVLRRSATSSFRASPITATTAHCTAPACSAGVLVYHVGDWRGGTSVLCGVGRDFRDRGRLPPVFRYAIAHDHGCRTSGIVIMGTNPVAVRASGIGDPRLVRPLWTMRWRFRNSCPGVLCRAGQPESHNSARLRRSRPDAASAPKRRTAKVERHRYVVIETACSTLRNVSRPAMRATWSLGSQTGTYREHAGAVSRPAWP
jgi:hypothetical protein